MTRFDYENAAQEAGLIFLSTTLRWRVCEDWPHISEFTYAIFADGHEGDEDESEDDARPERLGSVEGYIISQDWTMEAGDLWMEADALDGDIEAYVGALQSEMALCRSVIDNCTLDLVTAQRMVVVRHIEAVEGVDAVDLLKRVVACLALKETPDLMLVDHRARTLEERESEAGKALALAGAEALKSLGFFPMVSSDLVWGWNRDIAEMEMFSYAYEDLVAAKRSAN